MFQKSIFQPSKICLIYQAENLTTEAQNALLKTLEEPPPSTHLILLTSNHHRLLDTIISRSQIISKTIDRTNTTPMLKIPSGIAEAMNLSSQLQETINKDNLLVWLDEQMENFHRQILRPPAPKVISGLIHAKQMYQANVEPKAIIDWLFLSLISH